MIDLILNEMIIKRDNFIRREFNKLIDLNINKLSSHYGYKFEFKFEPNNCVSNKIDSFMVYIAKHDPNWNKRNMLYGDVLYNDEFIINLDLNTFMYIRSSDNKSDNNSSSVDIKAYVFGKYAKKYYDEINRTLIEGPAVTTDLVQYNVDGKPNINRPTAETFNSSVQPLRKRNLDTLFYSNGEKESIIEHIESFIANKSIYTEKDLLYKTGILLYGEPGTGKTSIVTALANHFKNDLIIVDINTFDTLDMSSFVQCINNDNMSYVILLEDIDTVFNLNRDNSMDKEESKVVNKLLQFLDSNQSPNNVIFIATTNHIEKLDNAILRDGRFDLKVEVKGLNKPEAVEMCKSFDISEDSINKIIDKCNGFPVNQSKLQNLILSSIKEELRNEIN